MSILYPVAGSADEALRAPKGRAVREREAEAVAGGDVTFVSEAVGPTFASKEALTEAFKAMLGEPWCAALPLAAGGKAKWAITPVNRDGRRWPAPKPPRAKKDAAVAWRLSISYWRIKGEEPVVLGHARKLRRRADASELDNKTLNALAGQPLRPVEPQKPLDIGLFEIHPPDAPHITMPDE